MPSIELTKALPALPGIRNKESKIALAVKERAKCFWQWNRREAGSYLSTFVLRMLNIDERR